MSRSKPIRGRTPSYSLGILSVFAVSFVIFLIILTTRIAPPSSLSTSTHIDGTFTGICENGALNDLDLTGNSDWKRQLSVTWYRIVPRNSLPSVDLRPDRGLVLRRDGLFYRLYIPFGYKDIGWFPVDVGKITLGDFLEARFTQKRSFVVLKNGHPIYIHRYMVPAFPNQQPFVQCTSTDNFSFRVSLGQ